MLRIVCSILFFASIASMHSCHAEDLTKHYTATLVPTAQLTGYDWTCEARDAWRLKSFSFERDDKLSIQFNAAQVVFGKHKSNVLWAVVIPDKPGTIVRADNGQNEHVTSAWLRFHPARLGELFPNETVLGQHDEPNTQLARQIANHKLRSSYHVGGRPAVVPMHHLIVDCETKERNRRFFIVDSKDNSVQYVDAFRGRPVPVANRQSNGKLANGEAIEVFDKAWNAFDRTYAMFAVKPDIEWNKLRDDFRPQAANAKNNRELAAVINKMLIHLQDLHVHVRVDGVTLPGFQRDRPLNASVKAVDQRMGKFNDAGREIGWAISDRNVGYIRITGLTDGDLHASFKNALSKVRKTHCLILDLRFNGGGSEDIAQEIAGHFLDEERVYANSQYRSGPKHTDLTEIRPRRLVPNKNFSYDKPVVVLQGQRTMSSAEAMTLMMKQCPNVITMGDRTAGSSGNPEQVPCGAGITVNLPRWIPMDADGKSFDTVGIRPDREAPSEPRDFTAQSDPVLRAAIMFLRTIKPDAPPINRPSDPPPKEVVELWNKVVDVNKAWLDPQPQQLSYTLLGETVGDKESRMANRVWIHNNQARWEFESTHASLRDPFADANTPEVVKRQQLILFDGDVEHTVVTNNPREMNQKRKARDTRPLRQGITWRTAMHAFAKNGLPGNSQIIERRKDGDDEIVVLETEASEGTLRVGLGIWGAHYGSTGEELGTLRLHIRLPQHVPVKEEFSSTDQRIKKSSVHYSRKYFKLDNGLAPESISYRVDVNFAPNEPTTKWLLTATFQTVGDVWLLRNARNSQNGKTITSLTVSDISTKEIPTEMFKVSAAMNGQQ